MEALLQNPMLLLIGGLGLLGLIVIVVAIILMSRSSTPDIGSRLQTFAAPTSTTIASPTENSGARAALDRLEERVAKGKRGTDTARALASADLKLKVSEFWILKGVCAALGIGVGMLVGRANPAALVLAGIVGAVIFSFLPDFYVNQRAKARVRAFNDQLGDTITMMANALRGGYSFLLTLEMVGREAPPPISVEFKRVVQDVGLGRTTDEALKSLLSRMHSEDLDLLITAVNIQQEVGGNLAQVLDTIGHTIRERVRIKGEIQTLTAQGRISAWVVTGLPIGLAIFISVINPTYMAPIFEFGMPPDAWCCLPVAALFMIAMGYFAIMKIIDIEV